MSVTVSLKNIVNEIDSLFDEDTAYLNLKTGELFTVRQDDLDALEHSDPELIPDWQKEILPKVRDVIESEEWLALPDKFDIHEWDIMKRFSASVGNPDHRDELDNAIRGSGAFRYFKDTVHRLGIQNDWYKYRDEALKEIVIGFLDARGITYNDG